MRTFEGGQNLCSVVIISFYAIQVVGFRIGDIYKPPIEHWIMMSS